MKYIISAVVLALFSTASFGKGSINDMQGCQAVIDFVEAKLDPKPAQYTDKEVATVLKGLKAYDNYIQTEIVGPGLLQFNGGDQAKADAMQKQVDAYKAQVKAAYDKRYPQHKLFTDHAVAINECAKKDVPKGDDLEALKASLQMMVTLARK